MSDTLVLFLPGSTASWRWLRIADDAVVARGEGLPDFGNEDAAPPVAIVPAEAATLHWADLPDRSPAQSLAAARLLVAEASAAPVGDLHVAVGREADLVERPIAVVSLAQMRGWLEDLAGQGVDPAMLLPAPMLLPRPETGFVRGDLGGEAVVRGTSSGFADEGPLTGLVTGGVPPQLLDRDALEAAIVAAVANPALDLRQGVFARRRRIGVDWSLLRRLGWLALAILSVSLLISLVQLLKYNLAADSLERQADVLARQALPRGETVNDADRQLDARLAGLRGGGAGFGLTAASVFAAVRSVPGAELRTLSFEANGDLTATIATGNEGEATDIASRIASYGFVAKLGPLQSGGGSVTGTITVSAR